MGCTYSDKSQGVFLLGEKGKGYLWEKEKEQLHSKKEDIIIGADNII